MFPITLAIVTPKIFTSLNIIKYSIIGALKNIPKIDGITKSSHTCSIDKKQTLIDIKRRFIRLILVRLIANSIFSLENPGAIIFTIFSVNIFPKINILKDKITRIPITLLANSNIFFLLSLYLILLSIGIKTVETPSPIMVNNVSGTITAALYASVIALAPK